MTQPAALAVSAPSPPTAAPRGPATSFVQRITASPQALAAPAPVKPSFARAAGGVLGDVIVGAPTSAALGVGYAKGVVTKPRLLAAAGAAASLAIGTAPYFPTLSGIARRLEMACVDAAAFVAGLEFGGGLKGASSAAKAADKIADVDAEL